MKIGIILHPYGEDKPAGLARTIFELTKGMITVDRENEYVIFLKKNPRVLPEFPGIRWKVEILGGRYLWLRNLKRATPCDTYLFNTPVLPLGYKPKNAYVLALDFAYVFFPPKGVKGRLLNRLTRWYHKRSLRRADGIIAISEATARDVERLFGVARKQVRVVLCGFKKVCAAEQEPIALPEKFFLFVGIVKERKNVFNVVRGFRGLKHSEYKLVIGGNAQGPYADSIRVYAREQGIEKRVIFIGHLHDGQLSFIYRKAAALVFPSFIEGFGYPVLEAMDCGLPVITSKSTSLGEICRNNSAILVDPASSEEINRSMERIVSEIWLREKLIKNCQHNFAPIIHRL